MEEEAKEEGWLNAMCTETALKCTDNAILWKMVSCNNLPKESEEIRSIV